MGATLRLGLTGGIGSGKSTVSNLLAKLGAAVIDADAISRAATAVRGAAMTAIEATFGSGILTAAGALDRDKMRSAIYADSSTRGLLESIVHPLVAKEIGRQTDEAEREGAACIVFDIPLLVETNHWRESLHQILVIDCSPQTQLVRVTQRSNLAPGDVQRIMDAQVTRGQRLRAADWVIFNDGISMDALAAQVQEISHQFGL